jgi:predicted RNase H-like HicB family nuclease
MTKHDHVDGRDKPGHDVKSGRPGVRPGYEGGGYLVEFPDLPGCMSDLETIEEAVADGQDAKESWIAAMTEAARPIPPPTVEPPERCSGR